MSELTADSAGDPRARDLLIALLSPALGGGRARQAAERGLRACGGLRELCRLPPSRLARLPGWSLEGAQLLATMPGLLLPQQRRHELLAQVALDTQGHQAREQGASDRSQGAASWMWPQRAAMAEIQPKPAP